MSVAKGIRIAREETGLTQQELADKVGTSRSLIARIERGDISPTVALVGEIAEALGCRVNELIEAANNT